MLLERFFRINLKLCKESYKMFPQHVALAINLVKIILERLLLFPQNVPGKTFLKKIKTVEKIFQIVSVIC